MFIDDTILLHEVMTSGGRLSLDDIKQSMGIWLGSLSFSSPALKVWDDCILDESDGTHHLLNGLDCGRYQIQQEI